MIKAIKGLFSKPEPVKENFYGGDGTIHQSGHVDVQLDRDGNVVAVWFRCAMLPFNESIVDDEYAAQVAGANPARIKGVVFEDE
jgi:hypothetical protein